MLRGLFAEQVVRDPEVSLLPKCGSCGLLKTCKTPKIGVAGSGRLGVLVVDESPGIDEDTTGRSYVGVASEYLRNRLDVLGIDLDRDCWRTSALICYPGRAATESEVEYCRPNLTKVIQDLQPKHIMLFGKSAIYSVLGPYWKSGKFGSADRWVGHLIPFQPWNCWISTNYHPAYVMASNQDQRESEGAVVRLWFLRYLQRSFLNLDRPYVEVPDYRRHVLKIHDPEIAANWIREKLRTNAPFSFDYETNMIKPDSREAEIVSASICWGGLETIAFPWTGAAIPAMREFLDSDNPKIGANNKFESRWTRAILGMSARNFCWDVVLRAHHNDNRDKISSVKFQALVSLGFPDWSYAIEPYLDGGDSGSSKNRIREVDLDSLLLYNGLDSHVQYEIAEKQRKEKNVIEKYPPSAR